MVAGLEDPLREGQTIPIRAENRARYPSDWKDVRRRILERAGNSCEGCGAENDKLHPITGGKVVLTIAHLDHPPENCDPNNLLAWCQLATIPTMRRCARSAFVLERSSKV